MLSENVGIRFVTPRPSDFAVGAVDSTSIDMEGWEGCLFVIPTGVVDPSTGIVTMSIYSSSDNGAGDAFAQIGSQVAISGASASGTLGVIDVVRPRERWIRARVVWNGTGSQWNGVIAIPYNGRRGGLNALLSTGVYHSNVAQMISIQLQ